MSRKQTGRSMKVGKNQCATVKFVGRYVVPLTAASTVSALPLTPLGLDSRLVTLSDPFQEFRFVKAKVHLFGASGLAVMRCVAYTPAVLGTAPATAYECQNLEDVAYGNGSFGAPEPRLSLGKKQLLSAAPVNWYRRGTPYDDTLETQGSFYFASTSAFSVNGAYVVLEYEVECRASADTALTAVRTAVDRDDPIASLEAKVSDLQQVMGMRNRVPNAQQRPAASGSVRAPDTASQGQAQPGAPEYVLVRRVAGTGQ